MPNGPSWHPELAFGNHWPKNQNARVKVGRLEWETKEFKAREQKVPHVLLWHDFGIGPVTLPINFEKVGPLRDADESWTAGEHQDDGWWTGRSWTAGEHQDRDSWWTLAQSYDDFISEAAATTDQLQTPKAPECAEVPAASNYVLDSARRPIVLDGPDPDEYALGEFYPREPSRTVDPVESKKEFEPTSETADVEKSRPCPPPGLIKGHEIRSPIRIEWPESEAWPDSESDAVISIPESDDDLDIDAFFGDDLVPKARAKGASDAGSSSSNACGYDPQRCDSGWLPTGAIWTADVYGLPKGKKGKGKGKGKKGKFGDWVIPPGYALRKSVAKERDERRKLDFCSCFLIYSSKSSHNVSNEFLIIFLEVF